MEKYLRKFSASLKSLRKLKFFEETLNDLRKILSIFEDHYQKFEFFLVIFEIF